MGSSRPPQVLLKEVLEYIARHGSRGCSLGELWERFKLQTSEPLKQFLLRGIGSQKDYTLVIQDEANGVRGGFSKAGVGERRDDGLLELSLHDVQRICHEWHCGDDIRVTASEAQIQRAWGMDHRQRANEKDTISKEGLFVLEVVARHGEEGAMTGDLTMELKQKKVVATVYNCLKRIGPYISRSFRQIGQVPRGGTSVPKRALCIRLRRYQGRKLALVGTQAPPIMEPSSKRAAYRAAIAGEEDAANMRAARDLVRHQTYGEKRVSELLMRHAKSTGLKGVVHMSTGEVGRLMRWDHEATSAVLSVLANKVSDFAVKVVESASDGGWLATVDTRRTLRASTAPKTEPLEPTEEWNDEEDEDEDEDLEAEDDMRSHAGGRGGFRLTSSTMELGILRDLYALALQKGNVGITVKDLVEVLGVKPKKAQRIIKVLSDNMRELVDRPPFGLECYKGPVSRTLAVFLRPLPHVLEEMDWPVSGSPRASPSPLRLLIPPREEGEDEDESERRTTMSESLDGEADERSVGGKGKGRMTSKAKRRDLPPPSPHSMHERERLKIGPNTDMLGVRREAMVLEYLAEHKWDTPLAIRNYLTSQEPDVAAQVDVKTVRRILLRLSEQGKATLGQVKGGATASASAIPYVAIQGGVALDDPDLWVYLKQLGSPRPFRFMSDKQCHRTMPRYNRDGIMAQDLSLVGNRTDDQRLQHKEVHKVSLTVGFYYGTMQRLRHFHHYLLEQWHTRRQQAAAATQAATREAGQGESTEASGSGSGSAEAESKQEEGEEREEGWLFEPVEVCLDMPLGVYLRYFGLEGLEWSRRTVALLLQHRDLGTKMRDLPRNLQDILWATTKASKYCEPKHSRTLEDLLAVMTYFNMAQDARQVPPIYFERLTPDDFDRCNNLVHSRPEPSKELRGPPGFQHLGPIRLLAKVCIEGKKQPSVPPPEPWTRDTTAGFETRTFDFHLLAEDGERQVDEMWRVLQNLTRQAGRMSGGRKAELWDKRMAEEDDMELDQYLLDMQVLEDMTWIAEMGTWTGEFNNRTRGRVGAPGKRKKSDFEEELTESEEDHDDDEGAEGESDGEESTRSKKRREGGAGRGGGKAAKKPKVPRPASRPWISALPPPLPLPGYKRAPPPWMAFDAPIQGTQEAELGGLPPPSGPSSSLLAPNPSGSLAGGLQLEDEGDDDNVEYDMRGQDEEDTRAIHPLGEEEGDEEGEGGGEGKQGGLEGEAFDAVLLDQYVTQRAAYEAWLRVMPPYLMSETERAATCYGRWAEEAMQGKKDKVFKIQWSTIVKATGRDRNACWKKLNYMLGRSDIAATLDKRVRQALKEMVSTLPTVSTLSCADREAMSRQYDSTLPAFHAALVKIRMLMHCYDRSGASVPCLRGRAVDDQEAEAIKAAYRLLWAEGWLIEKNQDAEMSDVTLSSGPYKYKRCMSRRVALNHEYREVLTRGSKLYNDEFWKALDAAEEITTDEPSELNGHSVCTLLEAARSQSPLYMMHASMADTSDVRGRGFITEPLRTITVKIADPAGVSLPPATPPSPDVTRAIHMLAFSDERGLPPHLLSLNPTVITQAGDCVLEVVKRSGKRGITVLDLAADARVIAGLSVSSGPGAPSQPLPREMLLQKVKQALVDALRTYTVLRVPGTFQPRFVSREAARPWLTAVSDYPENRPIISLPWHRIDGGFVDYGVAHRFLRAIVAVLHQRPGVPLSQVQDPFLPMLSAPELYILLQALHHARVIRVERQRKRGPGPGWLGRRDAGAFEVIGSSPADFDDIEDASEVVLFPTPEAMRRYTILERALQKHCEAEQPREEPRAQGPKKRKPRKKDDDTGKRPRSVASSGPGGFDEARGEGAAAMGTLPTVPMQQDAVGQQAGETGTMVVGQAQVWTQPVAHTQGIGQGIGPQANDGSVNEGHASASGTGVADMDQEEVVETRQDEDEPRGPSQVISI